MKSTEHTSFSGAENTSALRIAIAAARWNSEIVDSLVDGAMRGLVSCGIDGQNISVHRCPGSFELPFALRELASSGHFDALIAFGCVIRGETYHFELVANSAAEGVMRVMLETGIPCIFGVLTTDTLEQAQARAVSGSNSIVDNKGYEAAFAAVEMALLKKSVRSIGRDKQE